MTNMTKKEWKELEKLSSKFPRDTFQILKILKNRKSNRLFSTKPITLNELAFLLWASTGIQRKIKNYEFRTVPSAGALYPIETYLIANNVDGLEKALYHYNIESHFLEKLKNEDLSQELAHCALEQKMCSNAPVVIIWTAVFLRAKWKYGQRAYRYIYLDAGHIAQNLALSATSIGLGSCQIGTFFDDEINQILDINGFEESAIYMSVVGYPK
jgi:SagB-type dehydrogenase family enzyme